MRIWMSGDSGLQRHQGDGSDCDTITLTVAVKI